MSSEYETQLARERQEKKDHQRNLEQAASRAALAAEGARLDQLRALNRQEEIAELNSFRTTILATIPILSNIEKPKYIIQQISTRLQHFTNQNLKIKDTTEFYNAIGLCEYLITVIEKIKKTNEFVLIQETSVKQQNLYSKYKTKIDEGFHTKDLIFRAKVFKKVLEPLLIVTSLFSFLMAFVSEKETGPMIFWCLVSIGGYFYVRNSKLFKELQEFNALTEIINKKEAEYSSQLVEEFNKSDFKKNLFTKSAENLAKTYFTKNVFQDIQREQSFLPPSFQLSLEDWMSGTINEFTLLDVNNKLTNIDSEINKCSSFEWFDSGEISFE